MNTKERIGNRYGRLVVLDLKGSFLIRGRKRLIYKCKCDCGSVCEAEVDQLTGQRKRSCGCLKKEHIKRKNYKHGLSRVREYNIWLCMKSRCFNPGDASFFRYGGSGITVCDRWISSFENFIEDMGMAPSRDHSIDRINSKGNYEPSNCKWSTWIEQNYNKEATIKVVYNGQNMSLMNWARTQGLNYASARLNYKKGLSLEEIIHEHKQE